MDFAHYWFQEGPGGGGYQVENSLRFRGAQYLEFKPAANGNLRQWSWSGWLKRTNIDGYSTFFGKGSTGANRRHFTQFSTGNDLSGQLYLRITSDSEDPNYLWTGSSDGLYRDPSAWMHFLWVWDSDNATEALRSRWYVNGTEVTTSGGKFVQNTDSLINTSSQGFCLGARFYNDNSNDRHFEGYMSDVHFVDGQVLDPTDFGEFDRNGVWVPKEYTGAYGTNGFYLDFSDPADIGADRSGNGNDFTPTGFELGNNTSVLWDHMTDQPTTNFGTLNPLEIRSKTVGVDGGPTAYLNANQQADFGTVTQWRTAIAGIGTLRGEFFWEATIVNAGTTGRLLVGWSAPGAVGFSDGDTGAVEVFYRQNGNFRIGVGGMESYGSTWTTGDVIGCRLDLRTTGIVEFFVNGVSQGIAADDLFARAADINLVRGFAPMASPNNADPAGSSGAIVDFNLGQRPFRFDQGIPGYAVVNTNAAPIPNGRDHFQAITDTGADILTAAQTAFPNGLWWVKRRDANNNHQLVDIIRNTETSADVSVQSPGTTNANKVEINYTAPAGNSCVAWCWNAGSSIVTNNDGTIETQVSANTTAGFSIMTYTGNKTSGATIGHGLSETPEFFMVKSRDLINAIQVYHINMGPTRHLTLNNNDAPVVSSGRWNDTPPNNSVITLGNADGVNGNNKTYVCYAWHSVPGYSAFGEYAANNSDDGPFVYTGFRPAFVMLKVWKGDGGVGGWSILDSTRDLYNVSNHVLLTDKNGTEVTNNAQVDFLANGFKLRSTVRNEPGRTYLYFAFAENPFMGSNVSPSNAR